MTSPGPSYLAQQPCLFVAYAPKNETVKDAFMCALGAKCNAEIWIDDGLSSGDEWRDKIDRWICEAHFFVLLISREFAKSKECQRELEIAREQQQQRGIKLLPVLVADADDQDLRELKASLPNIINRAKPLETPDDCAKCAAEIAGEVSKLVLSGNPQGNFPPPRGIRFSRRSELERIRAAFAESRIVVLTGAAGVGKTELARDFAWWVESSYDYVFYHNLSEPVRERSVDRALNHPFASQWLLVLDNFKEIAAAARYRSLPPPAHVLFTSRIKKWQGDARVIEVALPDQHMCEEFSAARSGLGVFYQNEITKLVEELGRLPLALDIAGAYIAAHRQDIDVYLDSIGNHAGWIGPKSPCRSANLSAVRKSLQYTLDSLDATQPHAARLIRILSFSSRDSVQHSSLREFGRIPDELAWLNGPRGSSFHNHALVRGVVRESLRRLTDKKQIADDAIRTWEGTRDCAFALYCAGLLFRGSDDDKALNYLEQAVVQAEDSKSPDPLLGVYRYCLGRQYARKKDLSVLTSARRLAKRDVSKGS